MNHGDAEVLVARMGQSWHRFVPSEEWYTALQPLDAGRAGTAFIRLRDTEEHPPSIARFLTAYRAVQGATAQRREACPHCDGTGLVGEYGIAISDPCRCPEGERMAALRSSIATMPRHEDHRAPLGPSGYIATLMRRQARGDQRAAEDLRELPEVLLGTYGAKAREICDAWESDLG